MNYKSIILNTFLILLGLMVTAFSQNQPNIILIMADDLGYADLGTNGQQDIKTPELDKMADEGMKLTRFYTGTPVCGPARCNLMTGMHHGHCRIQGNSQFSELLPEDVTVAEVLKFGGYVTGGFGKWGLGNHDNQGVPYKQGFDHFTGYWDQTHAHNFWTTYLVDDRDTLQLSNVNPNQGARGQGDAPASGEREYSHTVIADKALSFIDTYKDTTFFLYAPFIIPHLNNEGSRAADGGYEVPNLGQYASQSNWTTPMKSIASMITIMDTDIGRIFAKLKEHQIDHKTLVIFTSDNGPTFLKIGPNQLPDGTPLSADDRIVANWFNSNGDFRGYKQDTFEGGVRMPTIIWWPGFIQAGSTSEVVGYHPDMLPTLADFAGVSIPSNIDGISMAPSWLGQTQTDQHEHLFIKLGQDVAVFKDDWKLVVERVNGNPAQTFLYNIKDDPSETNDLSAQNAAKVQELRAIWTAEDGPKIAANWNPQLVNPIAPVGGTSVNFGKEIFNSQIIIRKNKLTFSNSKNLLGVEISIFNAMGKIVFNQILTNKNEIELQQPLKGIFWIQLKHPNHLITMEKVLSI